MGNGNAMRDRPRVMLCTTCHLASTARLAMEFTHAGSETVLLSPVDHPARAAKAVVGWHSYGAFRPLHALRRAIEVAKPDLLVPCDERAVRHLHELYAITPSEKIRTLIERSLGDADSFGVTAARHDLLTLAGAHGARVARSMALRSLDDLRVWGEQQPFPWVLKADGSWAGFGVRIVRTLEDAETAYRQMIRPASLRLAMREAVLEHDLFWIAPWL